MSFTEMGSLWEDHLGARLAVHFWTCLLEILIRYPSRDFRLGGVEGVGGIWFSLEFGKRSGLKIKVFKFSEYRWYLKLQDVSKDWGNGAKSTKETKKEQLVRRGKSGVHCPGSQEGDKSVSRWRERSIEPTVLDKSSKMTTENCILHWGVEYVVTEWRAVSVEGF